MIPADDYLYFVDQALNGMVKIVTDLGDELANQRPDVPDTNTPYAILTHCLGVMEYWGGALVAGRAVERDRDAEFRASGPVDELVGRVPLARHQLALDVAGLEPAAPLRGVPDPEDDGLPLATSQGGALIHIVEELAQHRGQMEVSRDVLLVSWAQRTEVLGGP